MCYNNFTKNKFLEKPQIVKKLLHILFFYY